MTGDSKITSLTRVRKARQREDARRQADANSVKFGRTKAERRADAAVRDKAEKRLDDHGKEP
ncbi:DUF4169 family protein [Profundibacterium mesophilum]|uniref:Uncharacterized protein n=1 Tax=Profundibacterium mesophilum KAUST100406-0324 TaxID=1037889 RepID=A0A921NVP0_9RHOB|nr:DUF4169 family protein [Profundibacterium mesophilum]KAF0677554.1 hypothetical protein PMES_00059 [Profundibacterium mesophilum KAUST100406-0324]